MLSRDVPDTSRVFQVIIIGDATPWSITYDRHSDGSKGVIYGRNIFIILTPTSKTRLKNTLA
jgi:hypothetical protein